MHMVSEASALSGLTVRALHHYDAIGLLHPSARSATGYRLYSDEDIRTLRRIGRYQGFGFFPGRDPKTVGRVYSRPARHAAESTGGACREDSRDRPSHSS